LDGELEIMKDIVVCLFAASGFDKAAQGLLGAGLRLAEESRGQLHAIIFGSGADALATAAARNADSVTVVDHPDLTEYQPETCLNVLAQLGRELSPRAILFTSETYCQEIAPRLAHRLGGSAVGDGLKVETRGEALLVTRQVYGGKAQAVIRLNRTPAVLWLRARMFEPAPVRATPGSIRRAAVQIPADTRTRITERKHEEAGEQRLEDARVIVSGGRGVGGPEPFAGELLSLAKLLGGQMAATRAACDAGWVPPTWQVGQTGKKVAPELYLAVGISGAMQHMTGIAEARNIVAINTDPEAPIFAYCRFGVVGDYRAILPLLREKLAALQK
jgi:electron transfer flavoprotein alpha subunit